MKDQIKLHNRQQENKDKIIDATIGLIKKEGIDAVNVRSVCKAAGIGTGTFYYYFKNKDDLLLSFIMVSSFKNIELSSPTSDLAGRIIELYTILIDKYLSFGKEFMKSFYTPSNTALAAYMSEADGNFLDDTIMARCQTEIELAKINGYYDSLVNAHELSGDICSIVKGIIFEYALNCSNFDIHETMNRMIKKYLH